MMITNTTRTFTIVEHLGGDAHHALDHRGNDVILTGLELGCSGSVTVDGYTDTEALDGMPECFQAVGG